MTIYDLKLCVDPGHAGYNNNDIFEPGAIGPNGLQEHAVALSISKILRDMALNDGIQVLMTREDENGSWDLIPRAEMANNWGAKAFISIHCNSFSDPSAHGFEIWTTKGQTESDILATYIYNEMELSMPIIGRTDVSDGDVDKEAQFTVLTETVMPAVLIEVAFISNPQEEAMLADYDFQIVVARAILTGIKKYFGLM